MVLRNDSDVTVYIASRGCATTIEPTIAQGGETLDTHARDCGLTCEELQTEPRAFCTAACAAPRIVAIEPGGAFPLEWAGTLHNQREMPEACFADSFGGTTCDQITAAAAGNYTASMEVFGEISCPEDADCTCTPNAEGFCDVEMLFDPPQNGVAISSDFSLPESETVVLSVPGPVSCPAAPPPPGGAAACGAPGLVCEYEATNACGASLDPHAYCENDFTWTVGDNAIACELTCPTTLPTVGSACNPSVDGTFCAYGDGACADQRGCTTAGTWELLDCDP